MISPEERASKQKRYVKYQDENINNNVVLCFLHYTSYDKNEFLRT